VVNKLRQAENSPL